MRLVERALARLDSELAQGDVECNVSISVGDIGQWMVKFRRNGLTFTSFSLSWLI